jgi:hypothetical protein
MGYNFPVKTHLRGSSPIAVAAALSVAILIAALGSNIGQRVQEKRSHVMREAREPAAAQEYIELEDTDTDGKPDWQEELLGSGIIAGVYTSTSSQSDPLTNISGAIMESVMDGYMSLKESGAYTPEKGEQLGETIARNIRAPETFKPYTLDDLSITLASSKQDVLDYRVHMQEALAPTVDPNAEPEFELYARYAATGDASWLEKLSRVAEKYRTAEKNTRAVAVPSSAAAVHVRVVNAIGNYAETLERLVRFANDPIASMALLRTYNEAEREYILAFDVLADFYVENAGN